MIVFALYNIKGGVGKTASAVNLAYLSARDGARTLLVDLDPQSSSTFYFRIKPKVKAGSKLFLKGGKTLEKSIKGTDYENLDLLPADFSFRNIDIMFDDVSKSRKRLKQFLEPLAEEYDHIFLDCPPNLTLLSENVFHASDVTIGADFLIGTARLHPGEVFLRIVAKELPDIFGGDDGSVGHEFVLNAPFGGRVGFSPPYSQQRAEAHPTA